MKLLTIPSAAVLAFALSLAGITGHAQSAGAVAKVNGKEIPQSRADFVVKTNVAQGQVDSPDLRARVREVLIRNEILSQEASKKGLDKNPDYLMQIELNRQEALVNAFIQDFIKSICLAVI